MKTPTEPTVRGAIRRIDDLGRVVIPKGIRIALDIQEGNSLEIFATADGGIYIKKCVEDMI